MGILLLWKVLSETHKAFGLSPVLKMHVSEGSKGATYVVLKAVNVYFYSG